MRQNGIFENFQFCSTTTHVTDKIQNTKQEIRPVLYFVFCPATRNDLTTGFNHEEIRRPTMELLRRGIINLVEAIPPVEVKFQLLISKSGRRKSKLIESEITGISDRFKEEMKCKMGSLSILLNMSRLLSILRESFPIDEPVISFDDRTRIILLLLDRDSSVALLNSFTFDSIIKIIREKTHVIKDKSETEFTTWECNFQI